MSWFHDGIGSIVVCPIRDCINQCRFPGSRTAIRHLLEKGKVPPPEIRVERAEGSGELGSR